MHEKWHFGTERDLGTMAGSTIAKRGSTVETDRTRALVWMIGLPDISFLGVEDGLTEAVNNLINRVKRADFGVTSFLPDLLNPFAALRRQA